MMMLGKHHTEATKQKISMRCKGYHHTESVKNKLYFARIGTHLSKETRDKISRANTDRTTSDEAKKKISEGLRRFHSDKLTTDSLSLLKNPDAILEGILEDQLRRGSFRGCRHTEEARRKVSGAKKLWWKSAPEEAKAKAYTGLEVGWRLPKKKGPESPLYGKNRSEETRRKISLAKRGRHLSEEARRNVRLASLGRRHTEKSKEKIRESVKLSWKTRSKNGKICGEKK